MRFFLLFGKAFVKLLMFRLDKKCWQAKVPHPSEDQHIYPGLISFHFSSLWEEGCRVLEWFQTEPAWENTLCHGCGANFSWATFATILSNQTLKLVLTCIMYLVGERYATVWVQQSFGMKVIFDMHLQSSQVTESYVWLVKSTSFISSSTRSWCRGLLALPYLQCTTWHSFSLIPSSVSLVWLTALEPVQSGSGRTQLLLAWRRLIFNASLKSGAPGWTIN